MEIRGGENGRLDRKKTMTMNWAGLGEVEDDDDRFFESCDRLSSVVPLDLASSSDEDEDFNDCRISFSSAVSSISTTKKEFCVAPAAGMPPDYDIWMATPGSISERRRRLLNGMGLGSRRNLPGTVSIHRVVSTKPAAVDSGGRVQNESVLEAKQEDYDQKKLVEQQIHHSPPVPVLLVRSRSDSDIEAFSAEKLRKEDMFGKISKSRLTRTASMISAPCTRICPYHTPTRVSPSDWPNGRASGHRAGGSLTSIFSNTRFSAFFLIKNLDTGKEFIVKEYDEAGMWNRLSDLQTGKQLTMEEFEKCVGYSPVVKELMRRENTTSMINLRKFNSYVSKSVRMSKRRGAALLKNIKGVAHSMSSRASEKEKEANGNINGTGSPKAMNQKQTKNNNQSNQWVKVRQSGKSHKELSALHLCQEIQAHQGAIWTIKFSLDAHLLASAGEDRTIHVWEVQECEIMSMNEGSLTPLHPSMSGSMEKSPGKGDVAAMPLEKKKRGKTSSAKKGNQIPEYVHVPETMFSFSDKPIYSFTGHLDDVLDLSWSRSQLLLSSSMDKTVRLWDIETQSCLKLFAHNDYVTCIQFNPIDEDYFISGSLDAKVRIWNISNRQVVDWTDVNEMVTAACYAPDGQAALVGSHKGNCRLYSTEDCKLDQTNQIDMQNKKKSEAKKITGFQFSPVNPSEVLVTSADSCIRILEGSELVQKFRGFRNTSSQIAASYTLDAKYVICASEDSQVYVWKREEPRTGIVGRRTVPICASHEHFPCKDVSVAVPWHGVVKGDPPPTQIRSKKNSKRASISNSPMKEEKENTTNTTVTTAKIAGLPPLPNKNNNNNNANSTVDGTIEPPQEEEPEQISHTDSENTGESIGAASSIKAGDSPSISASSRVSSWSWFDGGGHGTHSVQPTAWGMVIVTATLGGEIRTYQNFGLPRRIGRQGSLF